MIEEETPPAARFGPYLVEYLGRRRGLRAIRLRVGQHVIELFATLDGRAARVFGELDGRALVRRKKRRPFRVWSTDRRVKMWIIAAASETYRDGRPRWTAKQIARNLKMNSGTHAEVSEAVVYRLLWKLSPGLARRRADYWRTRPAERPALIRKARSQKDAEHRAALKAAAVDELRRAGLL